MLLHIRPKLFCPGKDVALVNLTISELRLTLRGGHDLAVGRPYPNKHYAVAYRKIGRKAYDGFLLETPNALSEWQLSATWAIDADRLITHHVDYRLADRDFDTASDNMLLWFGCGPELGGWSSRHLPEMSGGGIMYFEPIMKVMPDHSEKSPTNDTLDHMGRIVERRQTFTLPTIERERLLSTKLVKRVPPLETAFQSATLGLTASSLDKRHLPAN